jgi:hypothetical protein
MRGGAQMDRTSILGDTIDYMKELLERIKLLQEEIGQQQEEAPGMLSVFRELNPNEMVARNTPKVREEAADAADAIGGNVRAEMLLMAPAVRRGAEGGRRHPGGDLLRRQAGAAAVHGEHAGHARARHPAVRRQLLQRLRHARLLLRGSDHRLSIGSLPYTHSFCPRIGCKAMRRNKFAPSMLSQMQREMISADAIKQELFKNAGYGGGCL